MSFLLVMCLVAMLATGTNCFPTASKKVQGAAPTILIESSSDDKNPSPLGTLGQQWQNPSDLSSVLMIIGGDIVQKAVAQIRGRHITPVAFSFGFVSYSFTSLLSAIGDGRLMPMSDCPSLLTNLSTGYSRTNNSWILGRILRDIEKGAFGTKASLYVSVYETTGAGGVPARDWLWWSGTAVLVGQLGIASVPWALSSDYVIMMLTVAGTVLALAGTAMPQWAKEKWAARPSKNGSYCLTRGNGHQHAVVILNKHDKSLNLEDLATARSHSVHYTRLLSGILAIFWIVFLLCVAGLQEHTWYLLGVGFLGMVQNVLAAGVPRDPSAMGVPMKKIGVISDNKVMKVLQETERQFPKVGAALVPIFFPGELRKDEKVFFEEMKATQMERLEIMERGRYPLPTSGGGSSSSTMTVTVSEGLLTH